MATVTIAVPPSKWGTISRLAALEGVDVAAWLEDFVAKQMCIVLETCRQELGMDGQEYTWGEFIIFDRDKIYRLYVNVECL